MRDLSPQAPGFTLGVKQPGQTFSACMAANAKNYSAGGWANAESWGTAGLSGGMTGHLVDQAATLAQKIMLSTELGQNAADALGLNTNGSCK